MAVDGAGHSGVGTERGAVFSSFLLFVSQRFVKPVATCSVTSQRFFFAVRWLMSLELWQPIKCYNRIVSPCRTPPSTAHETYRTKRELKIYMGRREARLMVKGTVMGGFERLYKQNKQKHKIRQEKIPPHAIEMSLYPMRTWVRTSLLMTHGWKLLRLPN